MTALREAAQQALEALEAGDWYINQLEMIVYSSDDTGTHEERSKVQAAITALKAALEQPEQPYAEQSRRVEQETQGRMRIDPVTGNVSIGTPTKQPEQPKFTLSCGCPSQHGGVPAYWERDGSTAFGMICEKHWHEYDARSEA